MKYLHLWRQSPMHKVKVTRRMKNRYFQIITRHHFHMNRRCSGINNSSLTKRIGAVERIITQMNWCSLMTLCNVIIITIILNGIISQCKELSARLELRDRKTITITAQRRRKRKWELARNLLLSFSCRIQWFNSELLCFNFRTWCSSSSNVKICFCVRADAEMLVFLCFSGDLKLVYL